MNTFKKILSYVKPYTTHLIISMICTVFYAVFNGLSVFLSIPLLRTMFEGGGRPAETVASQGDSIVPKFLSDIAEGVENTFNEFVFSGSQAEILFKVCILILSAFFLKAVFGYLQAYFLTYVEQNFIKDLRNKSYSHLHKLPMSYFKNEQTGELISRITNDVQVVHSVSAVFFNLVREPVTIIIFLSMALIISWQLTLFSFIVLPFSLLAIGFIGKKLRKHSRILQEKIAGITSVLEETISGVKVVKAFGMEKYENDKFKGKTKSYTRTALKLVRIRNLASPTTEFLSVLVGVVVIYYGGHLVMVEQSLDASAFLGFLFAMFSLMRPIKELTTVNNRIQEASAAAERIFEIIETEPTIVDSANPVRKKEFTDNICFENVSFRYDDADEDDLVLRNINFEVMKGEIIALVGSSGAGKTTFVDLLPRFFDPTGGKILIDGIDSREILLDDLRSMMGIVTQETVLFNESIKNNIAYGLTDYPEEKITEAAKIANAHNFIMEFPDGYNTMVGERGTKISGGQRQRLSIARALLKNPPIMIFDEATSALDNESELLVQEAIEKLMHDRTTFVIAHRLSTIQNASRIIVLDGGRIVQVGKHSELLADEQGLYNRLYYLQFRNK